MNTKIAVIAALLFSLFLSIAFFGFSYLQNKKLIDEFAQRYIADLQSELSRYSNAIRNDLIQGNIIVSRNRLAQMTTDPKITHFEIVQKKENLPSVGKRSIDEQITITIPVHYSEGGEIWGVIYFYVSANEIIQLRNNLNFQLLKVTAGLWTILILALICLYFLNVTFSQRISNHIRIAMEGRQKISLNSLFEKIWSPLIGQIYQTGLEVSALRSDIGELKRQEEVFRIARKVSHDIRSPLGALTAVLNSSKNLNEKERELLTKTSQRIGDIADDILNISKSKLTQKIQIGDFLTDIDHLIQEKLLLGIETEFVHDIDRSKHFLANRIGVQNILSNLINNAHDARSKKLSYIKLIVKTDSQFLNIWISDNGGGMDEMQISQIVEGKLTTKKDGNSIGLSSSKNLVESWNGHFSISSTIGIGTEIFISFTLF